MTKKVSFTLPAELVADASHGILLGEFNNWNPAEGIYLEKQPDGSMNVELALTAGKTYEYRYLLSDGRWVNDGNAKSLESYQPIQNCIIEVAETIKSSASKSRAKLVKEIPVDDLTKIDGINKKVTALLNNEKITTFRELARCSIKKLQLILDGAGSKFSIHNPAQWPKQAKLLATGKSEEPGLVEEARPLK